MLWPALADMIHFKEIERLIIDCDSGLNIDCIDVCKVKSYAPDGIISYMMSSWLKERGRWSQGVDLVVGMAVSGFLGYNLQSLNQRDSYAGVISFQSKSYHRLLIGPSNLSQMRYWLVWTLTHRNPWTGAWYQSTRDRCSNRIYSRGGVFVSKPHLVNRGDSYEVHHVPEEWVDGIFSEDRGPRGSRFTHWLHTTLTLRQFQVGRMLMLLSSLMEWT